MVVAGKKGPQNYESLQGKKKIKRNKTENGFAEARAWGGKRKSRANLASGTVWGQVEVTSVQNFGEPGKNKRRVGKNGAQHGTPGYDSRKKKVH